MLFRSKNTKERYDVCDRAAADSVPKRDTDRRHIVLLLEDSNTKKAHGFTAPLSETDRSKYGFQKSRNEWPHMITLCGPILSYPVPNITKTAAFMHRGLPFSPISATSGWSGGALPTNNRAGPSWIEHVQNIASLIGHTLPSVDGCDQGIPGRRSEERRVGKECPV